VYKRQAKQREGGDILNHPESVLADPPVSDVWSVGRQSSTQNLQAHGINTALDRQQADLGWIRQRMGIVGVRVVQKLRGIVCLSLELVSNPVKPAASPAPLAVQ